MRSIHTAALVLCLAALPVAHADDASRRAKAEEMLRLTKTDALVGEQLANLQTRVNQMAKQQSGAGTQTPAQATLTNDYLKQVQDITSSEVGWDKLRPLVIQSYAEGFTEPELDSIIAFYKTPAGQAMIAKTPELSQKTVNLVQDHIKEMQPKLQTVTQAYVEKMKAATPSSAPAGTAPSLTTPAPAAGASGSGAGTPARTAPRQ